MGSTLAISDEVRLMIKEKEIEIEKKYGKRVKISTITEMIFIKNMDKVEEYLIEEGYIKAKKD